MGAIGQDATLNDAIQSNKMYDEVKNNQLFGKAFGDITENSIDLENGQKEFSPTGKIIESLEGFAEQGRDNMILTMDEDLVGDPIYGDTPRSGTGESWDYKHFKAHINQTAHVVLKKRGRMSDLRGIPYQYVKRARRQLSRWFIQQENAHIIQAMLEGASGNLSAGLSTAADGIGLSTRLPSNMYSWEGTRKTMGTAGKNTLEANLVDAQSINYSDLTDITTAKIEDTRVLCGDLRIHPVEVYEGIEALPWFISPAQMSKMKADTDWKAAYNSFLQAKGSYKNPLFTVGVTNLYNGFLFIEDRLSVRSYNTDTADFGGTNGYRGDPTYASGEGNSLTFILGKSAIAHAMAQRYMLTSEETEFGSVVETEGSVINGFERMDFVADSDHAAFFATGNATKTKLATAYTVENTSFLGIFFDKA